MILITKEEASEIRKVFPDAELRRTCKKKSKRHRIYCPCLERYMRVIANSNVEAHHIISDINRKKQRHKQYQHKRGTMDDR